MTRRPTFALRSISCIALGLLMAACGGSQSDTDGSGAGGAGGMGPSGSSSSPSTGSSMHPSSSSSSSSSSSTGGGLAAGLTCVNAIDITTDLLGSTKQWHGHDVGAVGTDKATCAGPQPSQKVYLKFDAPKVQTYNFFVSGDTSNPAATEGSIAFRTGCATELELSCEKQPLLMNAEIGIDPVETVYIVLDGEIFKDDFAIGLVSSFSCADPIDCENNPTQTLCDPNGACVECYGNKGCQSDGISTEHCDAQTHTCAGGCQTNAQCNDSYLGRACLASGACGCTADANCSSLAPFCDVAKSTCIGCKSNADCTDPDLGAVCGPNGFCTTCVTDADCAHAETGGKCLTIEGIQFCSCAADTDCTHANDGPHCGTGEGSIPTCSCSTDFECHGATPACRDFPGEGTKCAAVATDCDGSMFGSPAQAPSLAAPLTFTSDAASATVSACSGFPTSEDDWFSFNAVNGDDVDITLTYDASGGAMEQAFIWDASGRQLGLSNVVPGDVVKLTYLPAGKYYVEVQTQVTNVTYTLGITRTHGNACATLHDCASEYARQYFRGSCDIATGACEFLAGSLVDGALCDSNAECGHGCTYRPLSANADLEAYCAPKCMPADPATCVGADRSCRAEQNGAAGKYCLPICNADADCGIDTGPTYLTRGFTPRTCDLANHVCGGSFLPD